jgi:hypothetical protein
VTCFLVLNCSCRCNGSRTVTSGFCSGLELNSLSSWTEYESESYVTSDVQSASLSWNKAPIWGLWTHIYYCLKITVLFLWGALSDERTRLSFVYATGPRQCSSSWVRSPLLSRPYLLPQIWDFPFRRLLRLAGSFADWLETFSVQGNLRCVGKVCIRFFGNNILLLSLQWKRLCPLPRKLRFQFKSTDPDFRHSETMAQDLVT